MVRVRLQVHYRVHSRQMLCVAGSAIPFGWSFLSIANVPMTWAPADIWTVEVELPAGSHLDYKYVVLEEQHWTRQVNSAAEGRVQLEYRREPSSGAPPDVQRISKRMAIVAWQPGPNRRLHVPSLEEFAGLNPGDRFSRRALQAGRGRGSASGGALRGYGAQALGRGIREPVAGAYASGDLVPRPEELTGVWEVLCVGSEGQPRLERRDVWGREDLPPEEHQPSAEVP